MQNVLVKISDETGLNEREKQIMQAAVLNLIAMTDTLVVGIKGGRGSVLNPLEDENYPFGIHVIYEKAIEVELGEKIKAALERKFISFFKMSGLDMKIEIELF